MIVVLGFWIRNWAVLTKYFFTKHLSTSNYPSDFPLFLKFIHFLFDIEQLLIGQRDAIGPNIFLEHFNYCFIYIFTCHYSSYLDGFCYFYQIIPSNLEHKLQPKTQKFYTYKFLSRLKKHLRNTNFYFIIGELWY